MPTRNDVLHSDDLVVRCMARKEGPQWVAVCLDYSLAAQGATLDQAKDRLYEQIGLYVREAMTVDRAHAAELLSRRAPLLHRLRFAWLLWHSRRRPSAPERAYSEALPLCPA